jgi:hypothetical protein
MQTPASSCSASAATAYAAAQVRNIKRPHVKAAMDAALSVVEEVSWSAAAAAAAAQFTIEYHHYGSVLSFAEERVLNNYSC